MKPRTLYDKIWDDHLVDEQPDGTALLYIDRHLVHEVSVAACLRRACAPRTQSNTRRKRRSPWSITTCRRPDRSLPNPDPESAEQIEGALAQNARDLCFQYFNEFDKRQGIVHIIGPEQKLHFARRRYQVCGDSHTATHGAFGALAYGIGTSEVEHVPWRRRP